MARLKDIAAEAGVSITTVSNVINGNHSKVSQKNIEKIQKIIKKYNYVPNSAARALSSKNSRIIAVFLPSEDLDNPHNVQALKSIANTVKNRGYYLMIFSNLNRTDIITNLKSWSINGVICFAPLTRQDLELFEESKIPTCFIDSYFKTSDIIQVGIDDYRGGFLAANYLIKSGHTNIGFASYYTNYDKILYNRLKGFKDGCLSNGLTLADENIFVAETNYKGGIEVANQIADKNCNITAVFATEDEMAIGIIEGARLNGIDVPNELSVIGFDNTPLCEYVTPKLTTIEQDIALKGEHAARMLIDLIELGSSEEMSIKLPVRIIERQSVRIISK